MRAAGRRDHSGPGAGGRSDRRGHRGPAARRPVAAGLRPGVRHVQRAGSAGLPAVGGRAARRRGCDLEPRDRRRARRPARRPVGADPPHRGSRLPPQTRVEDTVLDLTQSATDLDTALSWCARACGRRLTTPARLPVALDARRRVRWRAELSAVLQDVGDGCHSLLEIRYLRDVERRHGLPRARRQAATERPDGGRGYADVSYDELGVLVELDGRVAHPEHARWRDMERDNAAAITGAAVLRYGWADVAQRPCAVAAEVAAMLQTAGWSGTLRRCGSTCG